MCGMTPAPTNVTVRTTTTMARHTSAGNGCLDEGVELLVTADGELKVARGDALDLEILRGVSGKLKHLGGEVLKDGSAVHGSGGTHASIAGHTGLQMPVDTTNGELRGEVPSVRL